MFYHSVFYLLLCRFRAVMELIKPDRSDGIVSLKGLEYIDVPALDTKNYTLSFFTYKEGQYNSKASAIMHP